MTHPNAPSTERLREIAHPTATESSALLRTYARRRQLPPGDNNFDDAASVIDALAQENARLREALRHLPSIAENFLLRFNPYDMPEGDSQQWQALEHEIANARRALNGGTSDAE